MPEDGDDSNNEDGSFEVREDDPDYVHAEDLFEIDRDAADAAHAAGKLPPAFQEDPLIRRAYVQSFIAGAFHGATHAMVEHMLKSERSNLASLSSRLDYAFPGLENMAVTLRTVERRLGVDPDEYITYYFLCPVCWVRHPSCELYDLARSACTEPGCTGILYETKTLTGGKRRRKPTKPFATSSLERNIQRILLRPGKVEELNAWRQGVEDEAGVKAPVGQEDWRGAHDPDFRLCDIYDGWGWNAIQAGLQRRRGGVWGIEDIDVSEVGQRFVALPLGLVIMINIDWFRGLKRGKYSVGAIYATICNNPRTKRFLREETILCAVIPGPEEPSLEQMNSILEPFVTEACRMYHGVDMRVPAEPGPIPTHLHVNIIAADLPGSRKSTGLRAHTSKLFMCAVCNKPFHSLVDHRCYDATTFKYREDGRYLKYAFRARQADQATREEIAERRGVRWSVLNLLPDWFPARDGPVDFMHAAYLGEAKHVVQGILVAGGMFAKRSASDKPLEKLQHFFDNVWWPGSAGRVPSSVLITGGGGKADEWRNTCSVLAVALYEAWQVDGEVPDEDAPPLNPKEKAGINQKRIENLVNERRHANAAHNGETTAEYSEYIDQTRMDRNYCHHYDAVLEWLVSLRIYGSQSISIREAQRAEDCHSRACQAWARMCCHLTPYFHLVMHIVMWIYRLGPVYGWWAYPYERFNGFLSKLRHNGHAGELEATMMRSWVKIHLIHDLIVNLENLGPHRTAEDEASIADLRRCLQGTGRGGERGTLLTMLAAMSAQHDEAQVRFPNENRKIDLKRESLYALVFTYLRRDWQDEVALIPDTSARDVPGSAFVGQRVSSFSHVVVHGQRYGASTAHRGKSHQYAYVSGRQAVRINYILQVSHRAASGKELVANIAIVQPFIASDRAEMMPWASRATDLGIGTWKGKRLGAATVVNLSCLSGQFALASVEHRSKLLWITMSLDHTTQEPDQVDSLAHEGDNFL
ncbi:hypothetical protein OH77DRAFT_1567406 [Trametes cingulata]|nr:hypothetical protein OH77DRAFT_1567406 [Trametes cingulata]